MEKQVFKTQEPAVKSGLLPTPPMPTDLPGIDLTDNARQVLTRRYVRRGETASRLKPSKRCSGVWLTTSPASKKPGAVM